MFSEFDKSFAHFFYYGKGTELNSLFADIFASGLEPLFDCNSDTAEFCSRLLDNVHKTVAVAPLVKKIITDKNIIACVMNFFETTI